MERIRTENLKILFLPEVALLITLFFKLHSKSLGLSKEKVHSSCMSVLTAFKYLILANSDIVSFVL